MSDDETFLINNYKLTDIFLLKHEKIFKFKNKNAKT